MITVYTKPGCPACVGTMRYLERHELTYSTVDVTQDAAALELITQTLGYTSLPVVVAHGVGHWSGLRIDKLDALKSQTTKIDNGVIGSW